MLFRSVARVLPVDPVLLESGGTQAEFGRDGGDSAGVVGLDAADGDEGITSLGNGIRSQVSLHFRQLAARITVRG